MADDDQDSSTAPLPLTPSQRLAKMRAEEALIRRPVESEDEAATKEIEKILYEREARRREDEAIAKFPGQELKRVDTMAGAYILKRADPDQMKRFRFLCLEKETKLEAVEVLLCACVAAPAREIYLSEWDKFTGVSDQVLNKAHDFSGAGNVTEKKVAKRS